MGYKLEAFIGHRPALLKLQDCYKSAGIVELKQGISMIPLTTDLIKELKQKSDSEDIGRLQLLLLDGEQKILSCIGNSKLAYIEADYFGGSGNQQGIVWENNHRKQYYEPSYTAINRILMDFGVLSKGSEDPFSMVGLDNHRDTDDWLSQTANPQPGAEILSKVQPPEVDETKAKRATNRRIALLCIALILFLLSYYLKLPQLRFVSIILIITFSCSIILWLFLMRLKNRQND